MQQLHNITNYSIDKYNKDKSLLMASIDIQTSNQTYRYGDAFNPVPMIVDNNLTSRMTELQRILIKATKQIVTHYLDDHDIQAKIPLSEKAKKYIKMVKNKEYSVGTLRPDFIIDKEDTIKICEINARFPLNGLILSNYISHYYKRHDNLSTQSDNRLNKCLIHHVINHFDTNKPIRIIKGCESGYDIHFINAKINNQSESTDCKIISPAQLSLINGKLYADTINCSQFILELHQDEIMQLPENILSHLIKHTTYLNDIRTILIAHDKRLLSILCDKDIMSRYLDHNELMLLLKHIIPTVPITAQTKKYILSEPARWVLKKALSGKGDGMYIGKESTITSLQSVLTHSPDEYIAQQYIKQRTFKIINKQDGELQLINKYLVGLSMSFNDTPLGLGFFRAGIGSIVNVATQGGEIIASIQGENND